MTLIIRDAYFGELRVLEINKAGTYKCACICGKISDLTEDELLNSEDCGCDRSITIPDSKRLLSKINKEGDKQRRFWEIRCSSHRKTSIVSYDVIKFTKRYGCRCKYTMSCYFRRKFRDTGHEEWSRFVMKRDWFKCVACSSRSGLNSHHMDGWAWCARRRYDTTNGVTLCRYCHEQFHRIYTKVNNTENQFDDFLRKYKNKTLEQVKSKWRTRS